jgi:D-3-phosphoglycerate dehydrogenase / 2-oxoglutarate reductase
MDADRVLVVDAIDPDAESRLSARVEVVRPSRPDPAAIRRAISGCSGAIVRTTPLPRVILESAPKLRVVAKHGTGLDNIDLDAASELGVLVTHCPGANAPAVAEFALTCILLLLKPIIPGSAWLRSGSAAAPLVLAGEEAGLIGDELASRTVGVVGWGKIGRRVGLAVRGLGARVLVHDPAVDPADVKTDGAWPVSDLSGLLRAADVITIHVPLNRDTKRLIGAEEISLLKPGVRIVNTARGGVVDEDALVAGIRNGQIRSAALDVFEGEPPSANSPLLALEQVLCTPHIAGNTYDALGRMGRWTVESVLDVLEGRRPSHLANPEVLGSPDPGPGGRLQHHGGGNPRH